MNKGNLAVSDSELLLSIIVPVYNVEAYLPRCLDSLLAQPFSAWEAIIVDDGSTDKSGEILDAYAARDSRLRAVHKPNGGVSSARNRGLALAQGRYVGFVDGDDFIAPDMYEKLLAEAESGGYDMVQCDYLYYFENGTTAPEHAAHSEASWKGRREIVPAALKGEIDNSACLKLFRRELIGETRFDERLAVAEDAMFCFECCNRASSAKRISDTAYYYFQRGNSIMHQPLTEKHFGRITVARRLLALCEGDESLYFAAAHKAARETFSLISLVLRENRFKERLPELRAFALANEPLLSKCSESGRRLKMQLKLLRCVPRLYYALNILYSRLRRS